jgi:uncharacterized protein DUF3883
MLMTQDWSPKEVNLIVKDYFDMLHSELNRQDYNKTEHRKSLLLLLSKRSEGSIEFKHQNISAALINMGLPFIKGYKPRFNYQKQAIEKEISNFVKKDQIAWEKEFEGFSSELVLPKIKEIDFTKILNEEPVLSQVKEDEPLFRPIKINYLEKEQNNRSLGEAGEELIIKYEKWRLIERGKEGLANKIEWVSKERGDGTGFDILSRNVNGTDRYIEVKTTKLSKETPIYLTRTELSFATLKTSNFYLYRVFNFDTSPEFFIKNGKYEGFCQIKAQTFKGYF